MFTTEGLVAMTAYRAGRKNSGLKFTDTKELIVVWPNEIAPTTHADAAAEALRITRENGSHDSERRDTMTKTKGSKRSAGKRTKPAPADAEDKTAAPKARAREELCVFAFRLTEEERDAIHKAAGPTKASRFARTLLVAAARNDASAVKAIMEEAKTTE